MNRQLRKIFWPRWVEVTGDGAIWSTIFRLPLGYLKIQRLKYSGQLFVLLYMGVTVASLTLLGHSLRYSRIGC
jgi:hypothetical protein